MISLMEQSPLSSAADSASDITMTNEELPDLSGMPGFTLEQTVSIENMIQRTVTDALARIFAPTREELFKAQSSFAHTSYSQPKFRSQTPKPLGSAVDRGHKLRGHDASGTMKQEAADVTFGEKAAATTFLSEVPARIEERLANIIGLSPAEGDHPATIKVTQINPLGIPPSDGEIPTYVDQGSSVITDGAKFEARETSTIETPVTDTLPQNSFSSTESTNAKLLEISAPEEPVIATPPEGSFPGIDVTNARSTEVFTVKEPAATKVPQNILTSTEVTNVKSTDASTAEDSMVLDVPQEAPMNNGITNASATEVSMTDKPKTVGAPQKAPTAVMIPQVEVSALPTVEESPATNATTAQALQDQHLETSIAAENSKGIDSQQNQVSPEIARTKSTETPIIQANVAQDNAATKEAAKVQSTKAFTVAEPRKGISGQEDLAPTEVAPAQAIEPLTNEHPATPVVIQENLLTIDPTDFEAVSNKRKADEPKQPVPATAKKARFEAPTSEVGQNDSDLEEKHKRQSNASKVDTSFYLNGCSQLPTNGALGRAHLVNIDKYLNNRERLELKMADIIATVLFRFEPKVLEAFMNISGHLEFKFTRREKEGSENLDFSIQRFNSTVHVSYTSFD